MSIQSEPPKYIVVKESLLESIQHDQLPPRSRLAPIAKMSKHFGVSPSVIQRALNEMINEGFIESRGSSGYYVCDAVLKEGSRPEHTKPEAAAPVPEVSGGNIPPVFLNCAHHSDLVWRRTYEGADEIRRQQTERLIEIAENNPEFHFYFEQSEIPAKLPEYHERLKALQQSGQVEMTGGMSIPDLNMISGETLIRTLLQGRADYQKLFGITPEIACLSDAFGMPLQVPQVLALCGYKYLIPGRLPNAPEYLDTGKPFRWQGANGTSVLVSAHVTLNDIRNITNTPIICDRTTRSRIDLETLSSGTDRHFAVFYQEEGLFDENFCRLVERVNRNGAREIRFTPLSTYFQWLSPQEHPCYIGEFNPVFTGCYSTRIGNKQMFRKIENLMRRAEILAAAEGKELSADSQEKDLLRIAFHDSLCGCCTDAAQKMIQKKIDSVLAFARKHCIPAEKKPGDKTFFIANTSSVKGKQLVSSRTAPDGIKSEMIGGKYFFHADLPAVGGKTFRAGASPEKAVPIRTNTIKTSYFTADFSGKYPKIAAQNDVFGEQFGAIRIRPDFGSMWTERYKYPILEDQYSCEDPYSVFEGPLFYHAASSGRIVAEKNVLCGHTGKPWNGFQALSWKKDFYFPKEQDYFFLKITLDFKGRNTKVLTLFPHKLDPLDLERTDAVPFGSLIRKPYFEVEKRYEQTIKFLNAASYITAMGDWPVLDWCDFSDSRAALAIANSGTPGCHAAGENITFSLLRSGTAVEDGCLEPEPGAYDNGIHEYWFAFRSHAPGDICKAAELGNILNRMPSESRPLPDGEWLSWDRENIALSAAMLKEGRMILRFYEFCGHKTAVRFSGSWVEGKKMTEITPTGEFLQDIPDRRAIFSLGEIKTFCVEI